MRQQDTGGQEYATALRPCARTSFGRYLSIPFCKAERLAVVLLSGNSAAR